MKILPQKFYLQNTKTVARELLGKTLVRMVRGQRLSGIITETEAYLGINDPASHSYNGRRTKRNAAMYLIGGHVYVYMIYGIHFCFNVVTEKADVPEAVLIRALQPIEGIAKMQKTNGPGKLCQALQIDKALNGEKLFNSSVFIEETKNFTIDHYDIVASPRIGIDYAGEAAAWPLRFQLVGGNFI